MLQNFFTRFFERVSKTGKYRNGLIQGDQIISEISVRIALPLKLIIIELSIFLYSLNSGSDSCPTLIQITQLAIYDRPFRFPDIGDGRATNVAWSDSAIHSSADILCKVRQNRLIRANNPGFICKPPHLIRQRTINRTMV
jgi:hypothetical protein